MASPVTEAQHAQAVGLDLQPDEVILSILAQGQQQALTTLDAALPDLAKGADLMVQAMLTGGRLIYAGAGSSGLMALADAAELGGTYGIQPNRIRILMSGGLLIDARMPGNTEDDSAEATQAAEDITNKDTVIALSASGSTAYPMTIAQIAKSRGAKVICIANNADAPMFALADVAICLPTPPEVIAGSTRMGAGAAQKAALNMMSTLMGVRLGHIHDGLMVNVVADNDKLRGRAAGMVQRITGVDAAWANDCLTQSGGAVKPAVLLAAGVKNLTEAQAILDKTGGHLRAAMAGLKNQT